MNWRYLEHLLVMALGFALGTGLAMAIAPGDILLWVLTGAVLGFFCHAYLARAFGGEFFWPFAERRRSPHRKRPLAHH